MGCPKCAKWKEIKDPTVPHVVRTCPTCGRTAALREEGKFGLGLKVKKGDRVTIPKEFFQISANPLKGASYITEHGLKWFAQVVFGVDIANKANSENFPEALDKIVLDAEKFFEHSSLLEGMDLNDESQSEKVFEILHKNKTGIEWFGYMAAGFASLARTAIAAGDAGQACWAMACSERFRALAIFKSNFEDAVFTGQSVRRLANLLRLWDANKTNKIEGFWQQQFKENSIALSQAFTAPVTFIQDNAYLGGMQLDRKDARLLDFLLAGGSGKNAILVEIKTPVTPLLGRQYRRSAYGPSSELSGAIAQILDYRHTLQENLETVTQGLGVKLGAFRPKCLLLAGNFESELDDDTRKKSFELFRSQQRDVEIVTFDEFFMKIELLAKMFNVIRAVKPTT